MHAVFDQLYRQRVVFEGMILKPNMVVPGKECPAQASVEEVADATVSCLLRAVPAAVPGVAFLSGGQSRGGLGPPERHARPVAVEAALDADVFLFPGHSAAGPRSLERGGTQCRRRTEGAVSPGLVQQYGPPGRCTPGMENEIQFYFNHSHFLIFFLKKKKKIKP